MMYRDQFPNKAVFPVIHIMSYAQLVSNLEVVVQCQADGVFLIDHQATSSKALTVLIQGLYRDGWYERLWIGANFLGSDHGHSFNLAHMLRLNAVWTDNAKPLSDAAASADRDRTQANSVAQLQGKTVPLYFGGIAFKYQPQDGNGSTEAAAAVPFVDVITTSGPATGEPAPIAKLKLIREAIGDHPLAVASGVTPENAAEQFAYVDAVLVATGVNQDGSFYTLDPRKLSRLTETAHTYQPPQ